MWLRYKRVERREVDDIRESAFTKSSDYECKGCWPFSVVLGDGTKVWWKYINPPKVINIPRSPLLVPQRHRRCLGHIRIGPRDTMAPSAVTWKASYGRLGTGRLGTVITSIYFVVRPSQGSLERSLTTPCSTSPTLT
jgi:hypothetical protein